MKIDRLLILFWAIISMIALSLVSPVMANGKKPTTKPTSQTTTTHQAKNNIFDKEFRTLEADEAGLLVIQMMSKIQIASDKSPSVTVLLHKNKTVSVGLSGNIKNEKTQENIRKLQEALDKQYGVGKYRVGFETMGENNGLVPVTNSNAVGMCGEPKCSTVAKENPSPIIGFAIIWRGKKENPYPLEAEDAKKFKTNQMKMCATCKANKTVYENYINNSGKK